MQVHIHMCGPTAVAGVVGVRGEPLVLQVDAQAQVHQRGGILHKQAMQQVGALGGADLGGHQLQGKTRHYRDYLTRQYWSEGKP